MHKVPVILPSQAIFLALWSNSSKFFKGWFRIDLLLYFLDKSLLLSPPFLFSVAVQSQLFPSKMCEQDFPTWGSYFKIRSKKTLSELIWWEFMCFSLGGLLATGTWSLMNSPLRNLNSVELNDRICADQVIWDQENSWCSWLLICKTTQNVRNQE